VRVGASRPLCVRHLIALQMHTINIMRFIKNHEGERSLEGNGAAVCVGLGSALCQVVQGRCGGPCVRLI